jgi:hypothetical protein
LIIIMARLGLLLRLWQVPANMFASRWSISAQAVRGEFTPLCAWCDSSKSTLDVTAPASGLKGKGHWHAVTITVKVATTLKLSSCLVWIIPISSSAIAYRSVVLTHFVRYFGRFRCEGIASSLLAFELSPSGTLASLVHGEKDIRFTEPNLCRYITYSIEVTLSSFLTSPSQIASAMAFLTSKSIVHRDLAWYAICQHSPTFFLSVSQAHDLVETSLSFLTA